MQEVLGLPSGRWDFESFYSENPEDADTFPCKALASGALAIYLDIVSKIELDRVKAESEKENSNQRVMRLFNIFLKACSRENGIDPTDFDPFRHDENLKSIQVDEKFKTEYKERFKALSVAFEDRFGVSNCQEILGFDPFNYADYDEKMQEYIEEGKWMRKCKVCMQFVVETMASNSWVQTSRPNEPKPQADT